MSEQLRKLDRVLNIRSEYAKLAKVVKKTFRNIPANLVARFDDVASWQILTRENHWGYRDVHFTLIAVEPSYKIVANDLAEFVKAAVRATGQVTDEALYATNPYNDEDDADPVYWLSRTKEMRTSSFDAGKYASKGKYLTKIEFFYYGDNNTATIEVSWVAERPSATIIKVTAYIEVPDGPKPMHEYHYSQHPANKAVENIVRPYARHGFVDWL